MSGTYVTTSNSRNKFSHGENCATSQMKNQLCFEFVRIRYIKSGIYN